MKRMLFAVFLSMFVLVPAAAADDDHGDRHGHDDATVVRPGESIQAAVDAAEPGDTIFVKRGTYAEQVLVTTDGISLKSNGAKLVPPAAAGPANACSFGAPDARDGVCVAGVVELPADGPPSVTDPVEDVSVKGFKVKGFAGSGIIFVGAQDPDVFHNRVKDNGEYGIARFFSSDGKIAGNVASGSEEAGIYVGDSPDADVLIAGNVSWGNGLFGIFLRDAANGVVAGNRSFANCVGAIVLNTGPNVAGDWRFVGNKVHDNDRFCPGDAEEGTPPLSGIGIVLANASNNKLFGNKIVDNEPSGEVPFAGGVVVVNAGTPGANPPSGNLIKGNLILDNEPDVFWDGSGEGNVIERNLCETSVPDGLCDGHDHDDDHGDHDRRGKHH